MLHSVFIIQCMWILLVYRWLVKKNKLHKAHKILLRIYGNEDDASSCVSDIAASMKESQIQKPVWKACLSLNFLQRWLIERNAGYKRHSHYFSIDSYLGFVSCSLQEYLDCHWHCKCSS